MTQFLSIGQRVVYYSPIWCPKHAAGASGLCPGCQHPIRSCWKARREHLVAVTGFCRWKGAGAPGATVYIVWPLRTGETTPHSLPVGIGQVRPVALMRRDDA